jgi:hypothetical protein
MEGALNAFVAIVMDSHDELVEEGSTWRKVEAPLERYQSVHHCPWGSPLVAGDLVAEGNESWVLLVGSAQTLDEIKLWHGQRHNSRRFFCVTARQSIGHCVSAARLVFHCEIKAQELAHPMMLWNGSQALIKQKLQAEMISAH